MLFDGDFTLTDQIVDKHGCRRENLIGMMQDVQARIQIPPPGGAGASGRPSSHQPRQSVQRRDLLRPLFPGRQGEIHHPGLRRAPPATCGSPSPSSRPCGDKLGLTESKVTSDDLLFTLETVACLGACGLSPVLTVNGEVYPKMTPEKAVDLVTRIRKEEKA